MPGEVEFLGTGGGGEHPPPGRPPPGTWPWRLVVVAVVVVAAVAAIVTVRRGGSSDSGPGGGPLAGPAAAGSASPTSRAHQWPPIPAVTGSDPVVLVPPSGATGDDEPRDGPGGAATRSAPPAPSVPSGSDTIGDAVPLGSDGGRLAVLRPGRLTLLASSDLSPIRSRDVPAEVGDVTLGPWTLVAVGSTLWAVGAGINQAFAFDARTLRPQRQVMVGSPVSGAVALGGHLYVASGSGIEDIAPGATSATALVGAPRADALAADPSRHRLLSLRFDYRGGSARLLAYRPGTGRAGTSAPLPFSAGNLAVTAGAIWAGGSGATGGSDGVGPRDVLVRLDPASLRPIPDGTPESVAAAQLVAAGGSVIWARPSADAGQLWCVDARSGRLLQRWPDALGVVGSWSGTAFLLTGSGVTRLPLDGCRG